jgi:hypothetical protein
MGRYANSRHAYQWPRVTAMMGDGKTTYDHDHDNAANELAACSVSRVFHRLSHPKLLPQIETRLTTSTPCRNISDGEKYQRKRGSPTSRERCFKYV